MNYYEIWCDLKDPKSDGDLAFCKAVEKYLGYLKSKGLLEGFKIRRRKFGFAPDGFAEFNVSIEFRDLAQMDDAFNRAATRDSEVEPLHREVYSRITNGKFALYRDFPDPVRVTEGGETS
ncbi:hypothetical protein BH11ARM1_BH11ARM1_00780 [soil metagenome]